MKKVVIDKLEHLRANYAALMGCPFTHFYCPILFTDEDTELCQAHIVNQAFRNTPKEWTVQRKDVDNFYGSNFEADFTLLSEMDTSTEEGNTLSKAFIDKQLHKRLEPKILLNGKEVPYYLTKGKIPETFTPLQIPQFQNHASVALKINPRDMQELVNGNWGLEISKDIRLQALVSLVKAAYLTRFHMHGYRYALSAEGEFVGRQILGRFFLENRNKPKQKVTENASKFFTDFVNMARPLQNIGLNLQGTVNDRILLMCRKHDLIWGQIVIIRTGTILNGVLLPMWKTMEAIAVYLDFLKSREEEITISLCQFKHDRWSLENKRTDILWLK